MIVLRRFLVLAALMFWQGGFTFYAAVVVPVGQHVFGRLEQGLVTRQVTTYLNLAGAVTVVILAWDTAVAADPNGHWRRIRWLAWAGLLGTLGVLAWLHPQLDVLLEPHSGRILDRESFRTGHRWYLWVSTFQWGFGVIYALASLGAWRGEDAAASIKPGFGERETVAAAEAQKNVPPLIPSASPSHRSHHSAGHSHLNRPH
jgi:hypothetical protein